MNGVKIKSPLASLMGEIKFVYDVIICYNRCIAISTLDCAADGTLCGESNETIGVCGEPLMTLHSFFLGHCLR